MQELGLSIGASDLSEVRKDVFKKRQLPNVKSKVYNILWFQ